MVQLGLIGYPLSHSFSATYFTEKFVREDLNEQYRYDNFPLTNIAELPQLFAQTATNLRGLNVTIPYKEAVIPYLDELSPIAADIGAVNTILVRKDGRKVGCNTDVIGFADSLNRVVNQHQLEIQQALILGTGGASKAVRASLINMGVKPQFVSRRPSVDGLTYGMLDESIMKAHQLIVNTTPLGTWPAVAFFPDIPYHYLTKQHLLYDLVYNPEETQFMLRGQAQGAKIVNGLAMLIGQAEAAWEIWQTED